LAFLAIGRYVTFKSFSAVGQIIAGQGIKHSWIAVKLLLALTLFATRFIDRGEIVLQAASTLLCRDGWQPLVKLPYWI